MIKSNVLVFLILLAGCTPLSQPSASGSGRTKILQNIDMVYEDQIKTVLIRTPENDFATFFMPAVAKLGEMNLALEFDDLTSERNSYYAKLIHCNQDWSKSDLQDLDFLNDFNEIPILNFQFSVNTDIPYVHYSVNLPNVKIPGNYVVMVYRASDKSDLILTKRLMVYDNRISFSGDRNLIGAGAIASVNQQLNFTVNYPHVDILNPLETVNVTIRQNQRWDNIVQGIKPSFVREIDKQLEYRFFDESKMFKGGNEFRFFDLRSINSPGRNVGTVNKLVKPVEAVIAKDKSRAGQVYSQYNDYNGNYVLDNLDYRDNNFSNYLNVNFVLDSKPISGDVYVAGKFTDWNLSEQTKMKYDSASKLYRAKFLLKQGWYDYQYVVNSKTLPYYFLEGSHYETENMYEIFVYYKAFQPRADLLIGYMRLEKNQR
jgi:hypothetical protein